MYKKYLIFDNEPDRISARDYYNQPEYRVKCIEFDNLEYQNSIEKTDFRWGITLRNAHMHNLREGDAEKLVFYPITHFMSGAKRLEERFRLHKEACDATLESFILHTRVDYDPELSATEAGVLLSELSDVMGLLQVGSIESAAVLLPTKATISRGFEEDVRTYYTNLLNEYIQSINKT